MLNKFNQSLDNLPFLVEMELDLENFQGALDFLPYTLRKLSLHLSRTIDLHNLPPIKKLSLEIGEEVYVNYVPDSVDTLILDGDINVFNYVISPQKYLKLPKSLVALYLGYQISGQRVCCGEHLYSLVIEEMPKLVKYLVIDDSYPFKKFMEEKFGIEVISRWKKISKIDLWNKNFLT